jgi:hypothetical protein
MSVGHHPDHPQHTGDMQKEGLTTQDREAARSRIAGAQGEGSNPLPGM